MSGDGARRFGGRWNPPDSFSVLYTGTSLATVDAEFERMLAWAGLARARQRDLATIELSLQRVLDLRDETTLRALGTSRSELAGADSEVPQAIGEAAQHLGYEAIVAPSATEVGDVVAVFLTNRAPRSKLLLISTEPYGQGDH